MCSATPRRWKCCSTLGCAACSPRRWSVTQAVGPACCRRITTGLGGPARVLSDRSMRWHGCSGKGWSGNSASRQTRSRGRGEGTDEGKEEVAGKMLGGFSWKTSCEGERQAEKTPCRSHTSGGGISDALPGNTSGGALTSREASPSQRSFRARATASEIIRVQYHVDRTIRSPLAHVRERCSGLTHLC